MEVVDRAAAIGKMKSWRLAHVSKISNSYQWIYVF